MQPKLCYVALRSKLVGQQFVRILWLKALILDSAAVINQNLFTKFNNNIDLALAQYQYSDMDL